MVSRIAVSAAVASLLFATSAHAVDKCKVKVDRKTGVILVSASGVSGTLRWGSIETAITKPVFNAAACVADGKAKKCQIADPTTLAAKTPPPACTLYLDDDGAPCSTWISGCTPGSRATSACVADSSASPRFVDNGDGTVSDRTTCLMWEKKTGTPGGFETCPGGATCASLHDVNNAYNVSTGAPYNPDGSAYTDLLAGLNGPSPFAGHDDWRLPTITELAGLADCAGSPCIDPAFGPTASGFYWSASTLQNSPVTGYGVYFNTGMSNSGVKTFASYIRAVRSGS